MISPYGKKEIIIVTVLSLVLVIIFFMLYRKTGISFFKYLNVFPLILFLFVLFFFRDPVRKVKYKDCEILSPCDGFVTHIDTVKEPYYFKSEAQRVSIFMTMFDVHVQRSPLGGKVVFIEHHPGEFINAQREESLTKNENNVIAIKTEYGFSLVLKQIAGVFARRIVCGVQVGDELKPGQKIGMVKFGSRGEVYLPLSIDFEVLVKKGQHVKAGITVLGRIMNCR